MAEKIGPKDQLQTEAVSLVNNLLQTLTSWLEKTNYTNFTLINIHCGK